MSATCNQKAFSDYSVTTWRTEKCTFTWRLENFSFSRLSSGQNYNISSSVFPGRESSCKWCLRIYPKGDELEEKGKHISCFFQLRSSKVNCPVVAKYKIRAANSNYEEFRVINDSDEFGAVSRGFAWSEFFKVDDLKKIEHDDILILMVDVEHCTGPSTVPEPEVGHLSAHSLPTELAIMPATYNQTSKPFSDYSVTTWLTEKCTFTWRLENFSFSRLSSGQNYNISSSVFPGRESSCKWCLRIYPKGDNNVDKLMHISCRLELRSSKVDLSVVAKFKIRAANSNYEEFLVVKGSNDFEAVESYYDWSYFLKVDDLIEKIEHDDVLILMVDVEYCTGSSTISEQKVEEPDEPA